DVLRGGGVAVGLLAPQRVGRRGEDEPDGVVGQLAQDGEGVGVVAGAEGGGVGRRDLPHQSLRGAHQCSIGPDGTRTPTSASANSSSPRAAMTSRICPTSDSKWARLWIITSCCWTSRPGRSTLQYQLATLRKLRQANRSVWCSTSSRKCRSMRSSRSP